MSKLTERLAKKIDTELGIKVDLQSFISIRPKTSYKLAGAWSWEMNSISPKEGIVRVGSCWTATECARRNVKLYVAESGTDSWSNGIEIVPQIIKGE